MNIVNEFGIKPILLLAQVVNFIILLYILKRFLYKPILKALKDRKTKIAESLQNADEIEKKLAEILDERDKKLRESSKEAQQIIEDASKKATEMIALAQKNASLEGEKIIAKAETALVSERENMRREIRKEIAELVTLSLQKVTGKVLTSQDQKDLIKKSIESL